jgi:hypothetical protein
MFLKPYNRIFYYIILSLFIFIIFFSFLEFTFRNTHLFGAKVSWIIPDSVLGYRFLPKCTYWYKCKDNHPVTGTINSYGCRDSEWSLLKPKAEYRIAVIGDSFVEGLQVEEAFTFLNLLEDSLSKDLGLKVELMNFGRSGFTQTEELLILRESVIKFSPDMVLLFFFPGNDISDISKHTSPDSIRPFFNISKNGDLILDTSFSETWEFKIKSSIAFLKTNSAIISLIAERYNLYRSKSNEIKGEIANKIFPNKLHGYLSLCTSHPDKTFLDNYKLNKRLILQIMAECGREKKIKFMLVCCDVYFPPSIEQEYKQIDSTFNKYFFEDDLQQFSQSAKIEYIGLQRIFSKESTVTGLTFHWPTDGHWDYQGHRLVTAALYSKLKSSILN